MIYGGKRKAVTFSYDDGVTQDERLVRMLNRYGLKGTFNLNSELLGKKWELVREGVTVNHTKIDPDAIAEVYRGHEVAAHTLTHPMLTKCEDAEIVRQVECDRENLSRLVGYEVVGMAYPGGGVNFSEHVADVIRKNTGIRYARTTVASYGFDEPEDLYTLKPTVYHVMELDRLFECGKRFLDEATEGILYVWGHSYEFDIHDTWDRMEEFCAMIAGHDDIFYGTNKEILLGEV